MPRTCGRSEVVMTLPTWRRGHAHVGLFQGDSVGHRVGLAQGFDLGHLTQVNSLVYTPFEGYNAQDVVARTLVRPPAGMPLGRHGGGGVPCVAPLSWRAAGGPG